MKLCVLLKLKWTSKEIAAQLNLSIRGVETSRYRLRRKLGVAKGTQLGNFLRTL
ncbi:MAG: LuxR C-terminal-related transcriptional regulator [Bacteroidota bacterium]